MNRLTGAHIAGALVADAVLVTGFALTGRTTHAEDPVLGLWSTAWPFLLAALVGWRLIARLVLRRRTDRPGPSA